MARQGRLDAAGPLETYVQHHYVALEAMRAGGAIDLLSFAAASLRIASSACSAFLFLDLFAFWVDVSGGSPCEEHYHQSQGAGVAQHTFLPSGHESMPLICGLQRAQQLTQGLFHSLPPVVL